MDRRIIRIEELEKRVAAYAKWTGQGFERTDEDDPEDLGFHIIIDHGMAYPIDIETFARRPRPLPDAGCLLRV